MKIAINKIHFPITMLGYGGRLGIWTQGCSIHCPSCISRDTWKKTPAHEIDVDELLESCAAWLGGADGVTISGGEPFDQPEALAALLTGIRRVHAGDVLLYSGYPHQNIFARFAAMLSNIDVLISEPFVASAGESLMLRGSDNQRVFLLSALARERYPEDIDIRSWHRQRRVEAITIGEDIWMVGIPRRGELERLKEELHGRGYECSTSAEPFQGVRA